MSRLPLTLACGDYDRTQALRFGLVEVEGIDLNYLCQPVEETFWRMARFREFDAAEMSLGSYLVRRAKGLDDFVAIPVFPSRFFRHSCIFVNADSGIERPEQLKDCKMGVPEYQMTAAVWIRGLLEHEYGVAPRDMRWYSGGLYEPGRIEKQHISLPEGVHLESIRSDRTLSEMLATGELDALMTARKPSTFADGSGRVRRLFPNFREVERDYFRRTGLFPIMHLIVVRREIVDAHPWVPQNLYKAFCQAKDEFVRSLEDTSALRMMLPWMVAELDETKDLMGDDWWPYGLEPNRKTLETAIGYAHAQGLIAKRLEVESLFAETTLEGFKI